MPTSSIGYALVKSSILGVAFWLSGCSQQPTAITPEAANNSTAKIETGPTPSTKTNGEKSARAQSGGADFKPTDSKVASAADFDEKVLPVEVAPDDAPLRPIKGIPVYKLTNLRIGNPGPGPSPKLMVHYERISGKKRGTGPTLVIRTPDGNERKAQAMFGPFQGKRKANDFIVDLGFGGGPRRGVGTPKNVEVFLVQFDRRWEGEGFRPKFKVSNSVTIGEMGRPLQLAREWTPEEAAKLSNPPPLAPTVNANANVGEDTEFVGHTEGRSPVLRYADPDLRPVLGVLYMLGSGEVEKGVKVKCLVQLTPAYNTRQPRFRQKALFAKPGYAVGGLNLRTNKFVTAIQVVFVKQRPDGTLDAADSYTSKWIGEPDEKDTEGTVTSDGRKVIGMRLKHFGKLHAVALVLE